MGTFKKLSVRIGLICFGVLLALLVLETLLRISGVSGYQETLSIYEFDELLGWRTKESSKTFRSTRNFAHFNYFDPQGFPVDRENWRRHLDPETPSIAFIGDSFTEGFYLPYEHTFTYLIDQKFPNKQVVNLGVSGYAPDQYLITARRHIQQYNVTDVVVMFYAANDLADLFKQQINGYAKPIFGESSFEPENVPLQKLKGNSRVGFRGSILRKINDHSALARTLNPYLFRYVPGLMGAGASAVAPDLHARPAMRKALRIIKQIEIEFPANSFFVYYVPDVEEALHVEALKHNIALYRLVCSEVGLECYTPERILSTVSDPRELYIPVNRHLSKLGAKAVADHLFQILSENEAK